MTIPMAYQHPEAAFEAFLADARDALDLPTRNPAYTAVQGVFIAFRKRLTAEQVLLFAGVLPPVLRALFVDGWTPDEYVPDVADRDVLNREVKALRRHHNLAPDHSIEIIARILREHVDAEAFDAVLARLPEQARTFWQPAQ